MRETKGTFDWTFSPEDQPPAHYPSRTFPARLSRLAGTAQLDGGVWVLETDPTRCEAHALGRSWPLDGLPLVPRGRGTADRIAFALSGSHAVAEPQHVFAEAATVAAPGMPPARAAASVAPGPSSPSGTLSWGPPSPNCPTPPT